MTYDSPFWVANALMIPEFACFKEEGLVTQEVCEREKEKLKICWSMGELNPGHLRKMQKYWPLHHTDIVIR